MVSHNFDRFYCLKMETPAPDPVVETYCVSDGYTTLAVITFVFLFFVTVFVIVYVHYYLAPYVLQLNDDVQETSDRVSLTSGHIEVVLQRVESVLEDIIVQLQSLTVELSLRFPREIPPPYPSISPSSTSGRRSPFLVGVSYPSLSLASSPDATADYSGHSSCSICAS